MKTTTNTPTESTTETVTMADVQMLADAIARDGIDAHRDAVANLTDSAEGTGLYPAAVEVLQTASTRDVVRARAFLVLARNWPEIAAQIAASDKQKRAFDSAFRALSSRWEQHRKLRRVKSPQIDDLWRSRTELDAARAEMVLARIPR